MRVQDEEWEESTAGQRLWPGAGDGRRVGCMTLMHRYEDGVGMWYTDRRSPAWERGVSRGERT